MPTQLYDVHAIGYRSWNDDRLADIATTVSSKGEKKHLIAVELDLAGLIGGHVRRADRDGVPGHRNRGIDRHRRLQIGGRADTANEQKQKNDGRARDDLE